MTFQGDSGVTASEPSWPVVICLSPGPRKNNFRIRETDSRDPETESGSLESEKSVRRTHGTLKTGLQRMRRSLVAPTRGASGYLWGKCEILHVDEHGDLFCAFH